MLRLIKFNSESEYVDLFTGFPKELYGKREYVQNETEERQLLLGTHTLSSYFTLHKFIVMREDTTVGRYVITIYPDDDTAYFGFYECIDDEECAKYLFNSADEYAKKLGCSRIVGPVDASFWIKYRLKTNKFGTRPYTGEPYNKRYYQKQFENNGFDVLKRYISNQYSRLPAKDYTNKKYEDRYNEFINKGYRIISPKKSDFRWEFKNIYRMLMKLYSDFPAFKPIEENDFIRHYDYFNKILTPEFVKIAYYGERAVGFMIGMPNYHNSLCGKLTLFDYAYVIGKKIRSNEYVLLYMGVEKEHKGLGKALSHAIMLELHKKNATSIGALIKDDNSNRDYVSERIESRFEYKLYEKVMS